MKVKVEVREEIPVEVELGIKAVPNKMDLKNKEEKQVETKEEKGEGKQVETVKN